MKKKLATNAADWAANEIGCMFSQSNGNINVPESALTALIQERNELLGLGVSPLGKVRKTPRGFKRIDFIDRYDVKCSLQQSSLATEDAIWLGPNDADPRVLVKGDGWKPVPMPADYHANTRMHLNRDQVIALVAHLNAWLKSGSFKL